MTEKTGALTLEAGFLAIFFAPFRWREKLSNVPPPQAVMVWLLRWLLFRLMLQSGLVKILSGDPSWAAFTALQGSPPVLELLQTNPFPDKPPLYVRSVLYDYRFTDLATKAAEGAWWKRQIKGEYCPTLALPP